ncbi:hypothetical protein, partial [Marinobacter oulmenensis]|uniref:hypothetical protein n=1 Tax=Marinobacter oulmenensis TaxID=643747 RepID=UPI00361C9A62
NLLKTTLKSEFSDRSLALISRIRHTSASAHTNYLVHLLKSVEPLLNQGRVFYITSRPCQLLFAEISKESVAVFSRNLRQLLP